MPGGESSQGDGRSVTRQPGPGSDVDQEAPFMSTPHPSVPAGSIIVGVDCSESAAHALDWATSQPLLEHRPLTLVHGLG